MGAEERTPLRPHLFGGGVVGNERLTGASGVLLILLLAVIGVTLMRLRALISVHLFVGLLLIPPVLLKLGSTGYRFARYYTSNAPYRARGAPPGILRLSAPMVVLSTVGVPRSLRGILQIRLHMNHLIERGRETLYLGNS